MELLRIDEPRFSRDFERLAEIGATGDGGVHRPALGEAHLEARRWFRERILADGLEPHSDAAGNLSATLRAADPDAPTLLLGSHLDSVPRGGRFDGALGVLAAYEALRAVRDAGLELPVHLEAIDFTDEEGTLVGLLGSRALAGSLAPAELAEPRCGRERLELAFAAAELDLERLSDARRDPASLAGFLELHIEQGPRLASAGAAIGVVRGIFGMGSYEVSLQGRADHAGTTPLDQRLDAGLGAAALMVAVDGRVRREFPDCVINFGRAAFEPGAYNIVPERAELALELRAPDEARMRELDSTLAALCSQIAEQRGLGIALTSHGCCCPPTACSPDVREAILAVCGDLDLAVLELTSGAGHDAGVMTTVCPAGMIFVPSTGGSHSPREFAEWRACVDGANVLLHAALKLASAAA